METRQQYVPQQHAPLLAGITSELVTRGRGQNRWRRVKFPHNQPLLYLSTVFRRPDVTTQGDGCGNRSACTGPALYQPRRPTETVLYRLVQQQFEAAAFG